LSSATANKALKISSQACLFINLAIIYKVVPASLNHS